MPRAINAATDMCRLLPQSTLFSPLAWLIIIIIGWCDACERSSSLRPPGAAVIGNEALPWPRRTVISAIGGGGGRSGRLATQH